MIVIAVIFACQTLALGGAWILLSFMLKLVGASGTARAGE